MKTFKMISFQIIEQDAVKNIDFIDGLIINKEDEKRTWLLEAFVDISHYDYFRDAQQMTEDLEVQAVISRPENNPAVFLTHIRGIKKLGSHMSILFEGHIKRLRNEYAELLLDDLIQQGFEGEQLLLEFKEKLKSKPEFAANR
ncbi:hypothetical protein J2S13_000509 [Oikeobacillus pervagus]|uniref:YwpF-like protein n=1 Tax=Oikeobacillus pervagus TaxID=1325931 RepID=A0AAJ1WI77_9BACI|nr:YwpF-like family protein [Oikeobacillus pervagus]MDQ0214113.1 hypothetical protein [Oikeobacillus pervagus]